MLRSVKALILAGAVGMGLLAVNAPARADIIPQLEFTSPSPVPGRFLWAYDATLTAQQFLKSGDFFTVYDFAGLIPLSNSQPVNWVFSSANLGLTPGGLTVVDSPALPNLTWMYTGPDTSNGPTDLGIFSAKSIYEAETLVSYGALGHKWDIGPNGPRLDHGTLTMNKGTVIGPVVPEPCSMALLGLGAAPLLRLRRRNRKA